MPNYRQELARSHYNLGGLLVGLGTPEKAEAAYRSALKIQEQLAADFSNVPAYRKELATSHADLGVLLLGLGKRGEAEAAYRAALNIREQLAADFPSLPDVAVDLGQSYTNFGNLLTKKREPQAALDWLAKAIGTLQPVLEKEPRQVTARHFLCYAHWFRALALDALGRHADALQDWDRALALDPAPADQGSIRLSRALSLARAGEHAKAVTEANALTKFIDVTSGTLYDLTCVCALAAAAVRNDAKLPDQYAARAVELLRQAVAKGYDDAARMKTDQDLIALVDREDFKMLLAELEAAKQQEKK